MIVIRVGPGDDGDGATVRVTLAFADGTSLDRTYQYWSPGGIFRMSVAQMFPAAAGRPYRAVIESLPRGARGEQPPLAVSVDGGQMTSPVRSVLGDESQPDTYVLVANTSTFAAQVRVTLLFEDATQRSKSFTVAANSRFNVAVAMEFPDAAGRAFGVLIESLGADAAQLVVEKATYWNAGGVSWAAGTNSLGTRLP
jgi:hypothetical protein